MAAEPLEIVFQNASSYPEVRLRVLRPWLDEVVRSLAPTAVSLGVRFVGRRAMQAMNRRYRGRDAVTDVLSFPGEHELRSGDAHLGDIAICVPQTVAQAARRGHGPERELRLLLLHGVLHCLGYDHETDAGEMAVLERRLRRRWLGPVPR